MHTDRSPHHLCVWQEPRDWDAVDVNRDVPHEPGYYVFTNHADPLSVVSAGKAVLYVGIATTSIRDRMRKYRTGDASGLSNMHRGGFFMFLSRASAAHAGADGSLTHSVIRKPINVINRTGTGPSQRSVIQPDKFYLRWAVDYRAAIEALLIRDLQPTFNTMHNV